MVVFWVVAPCCILAVYQRFIGMLGTQTKCCMVQQLRRPPFIFTSLWITQILYMYVVIFLIPFMKHILSRCLYLNVCVCVWGSCKELEISSINKAKLSSIPDSQHFLLTYQFLEECACQLYQLTNWLTDWLTNCTSNPKQSQIKSTTQNNSCRKLVVRILRN
jgi:hypothetical protein